MITRREFMESLAGAAGALGSLAPIVRCSRPVAAATGRSELLSLSLADVSAKAKTLYNRAFVLDCNTLASIGLATGTEEMQLLRAVRESGVSAVKSTLGGAGGTSAQAEADIAAADRLVQKHADLLHKVRVPADLDREGRLGVIYSFEAASPLEDKIERIEHFRRLGVLVMQLTYNRRTPFGAGCLDGDESNAGGLTELGRQAVARMNAIGVAVDLSHCNTRTTAEGIAASRKPPIFSHAGCRAIYRHPRSKEDREMKALADKGGVMGIYMLPFLTASPKQPALADYMDHLAYALKICGEDHIGVGSDVSFQPTTAGDLEAIRKDVEQRKAAGISAPGEDRPPYIPDLNTPRKMETIADAMLKRGYPSRVVEKVLGENFRRVFREIWIG